jgi:NAD(P)H-dependent flavin oxidoreductase YrpB (nitropropane dioxygenase family)
MARAQLDVVLEERVPVFTSGLGNPAFILEAAHARGMKVFGLVGKTRQARREVEAGVDAIIAQGYDAAGHTGSLGTFSIVPEVVAVAGDTPVIAAGGITTGRHLAAALVLGAAGVWTGTLWLACRESDEDMIIKEKLLAASADDTVYSRCVSGMPMRVLKCVWTEEWSKPDAPPVLPSPYQMLLSADYIQAANDHRRADLMFEAAGQGVSFVKTLKPARQIVLDMVEEALEAIERLAGEASCAARGRADRGGPTRGRWAERGPRARASTPRSPERGPSATAGGPSRARASQGARSSRAHSRATTWTTAIRRGAGT